MSKDWGFTLQLLGIAPATHIQLTQPVLRQKYQAHIVPTLKVLDGHPFKNYYPCLMFFNTGDETMTGVYMDLYHLFFNK